MTQATHTLGPWIMNGADIEALVDPENSKTYYAPICHMADGWNSNTEDANAALISAAPDLLAALEWAVDVANADQYETCWYATARMAIAKAKGADQ